ncbi:ABC transporter ATP-binding protein [bacterium]|nr:MAG: ABC transporter ATP-binding protein [bacterium]
MSASNAAPVVQVRGLEVTFADEKGGLVALQDVSFDLHEQEFLCVLGPSGSGKTTLLRVLGGLLPPSGGSVKLKFAAQPRVSLVFQQANLMPWRTVLQNITLPLELAGVDAATANARAAELVELIGLQGFEHNWPRELSGGMAQRVALARAFIQDPELLLLDEPFGALDALTREKMGAELLHLWQERRTSVLMVTHSISEALLLADRVLVLTQRPGRVAFDLPVDLPRPRNEEMRYSAHFAEQERALHGAIG